MIYDRRKRLKSIKADLPRDLKYIELHCLADIHLGDKHCNVKAISERIKHIQENENAYCILNGDILNNATKTSISDIYNEQLTPMQQVQMGIDLLNPIKDKIIAITSGNHENRTYKKEGINLTELLVREMKLYDKYCEDGALIFLRFGRQSRGRRETANHENIRRICYTVYVTHGSSGGRKIGAKAIRLLELSDIVDADLYFRSHTHAPIVLKQGYYRTDTKNSCANFVEKVYINTASSLVYGGYAQSHEYVPASMETPVAVLNGTKKEIQVKY